jgi:hypothetical protein
MPVTTTDTIATTHATKNMETDTKANNTHPGQTQDLEQWPQYIDPRLLMKNPTMPQGLGNWNKDNGSTSNDNNASQNQFSLLPTGITSYPSLSAFNGNDDNNDNGPMAAVSGGEGTVKLDKDLLDFDFGEFDPTSFGIDENTMMMFFGQQPGQQQHQPNIADTTTINAGAVAPNSNMNMNVTTDTVASAFTGLTPAAPSTSATLAAPVARNQKQNNPNLVYSNKTPHGRGQAAAQAQAQNAGLMTMNNFPVAKNPSSQHLSAQTPRQQYPGNSSCAYMHPQRKRLF